MILKLKGARFINPDFQLDKEKVDIAKSKISIMNVCDKIGFVIKKYFIDYKYSEKSEPLCIKIPKMSGYAKYFDETKHLNFLIK